MFHKKMPCGTNISVGVFQTPLGLQFEKSSDGTLINLRGYEYQLLLAISEILNFSYTIFDRSELSQSNVGGKAYDLLIEELGENKTDIMLASLSVTPNRLQIVDFTPAYFVDRVSFFLRSYQNTEFTKLSFTEPFSIKLWQCLVLCTIFYIFILATLTRDRSTAVLIVLSGVFMQGYSFKSSNIRRYKKAYFILFGFWVFCGIFLSYQYASALTASSSVTKSFSINTYDQLILALQRKDLVFGVLEGTSTYELMLKWGSSNEHLDAFRQVFLVYEPNKFMTLLQQGRLVALSGEKTFIAFMLKNNWKNFYMLKETLYYENVAIALRKNFICENDFAIAINMLRETGCLDKWERDLKLVHSDSFVGSKDDFRISTVQVMASIFEYLSIGCIMALCVVVFEIFLAVNFRRKKSKRKKVRRLF